MASPIRLTLKTKFLIMLTVLPVLPLIIFFFMAFNIFGNDKVAYVSDTVSSVSKAVSSEVATGLSAALVAAKPIIQEYLLTSQFATLSKSLFDSDNSMEAVAVYQWKNKTAQKIAVVEKEGGNFESQASHLPAVQSAIQEATVRDRVVTVPFGDDRVFIVEKVIAPTGVLFFVIVTRLRSVYEAFQASDSADMYLVQRDGQILFGAEGSSGQNLSSKVELDVAEKLDEQKFKSGMIQLKSATGEALLVGLSKVGFGDLMTVSVVPKRDALAAVNEFLKSSLYLLGILLCVIFMVGLLAAGGMTSALRELAEATRKITEGQFDIRVNIKSKDEVGVLAGSFNAMAEEVSRLMKETAEKARMQSELSTAQTVQETLFPPPEAELNGLNVAGFYEPASECGGDWWHYYQAGDRIYVWIGDATGHGAPAALITSAAKSAATIIEQLRVDPSTAMSLMNRAIYDVSKGSMLMTFFLGCYDSTNRKFTYANASHEAPYFIRPQEAPLKKRNLVPLNEVNSPRLGQARDTEYKQTTIDLEIGDRILFYTDGLADIQDENNKAWGEREFIKTFIEVNEGYPPVHESVYRLREAFTLHRRRARLIDDVTYFMIQVTEAVQVTTSTDDTAEEQAVFVPKETIIDIGDYA